MNTALSFEYDGISSSVFGLKVASLQSSSTKEEFFGTPLTIVEEVIVGRTKPSFIGTTMTGKIEFNIELISEKELTITDLQAINLWLFKRTYKKLLIVDERYTDIYFNAIFIEPQKILVGNVPYGLKVKIVCDAPYGYKDITLINPTSVDNATKIYDYTYPELVLHPTITPSTFRIVNNTTGETFEILNVTNTLGNNISIDCAKKIMPASLFQNFNLKWTRFVPGVNSLTLTGNIDIKLKIPKTI
jgi:hypothetical protein